jgi:hypothetical protein
VESKRAAHVAALFGTRHQELHVDGADIARDLPAVLARLDQPTIDAVNSYYVSRAVASTGIKAVLSGAGGDEMFGGYPSFTRLPRAMAAKRLAAFYHNRVFSLPRAARLTHDGGTSPRPSLAKPTASSADSCCPKKSRHSPARRCATGRGVPRRNRFGRSSISCSTRRPPASKRPPRRSRGWRHACIWARSCCAIST